MSTFYVSDMDSYLLAVLQHVKSEQGRSLRCLWKNTCFCQYLCQCYTSVICMHILMLCYSRSKVNKVVPCSVLGKHVFLSIHMSMLYVSDMHTYLDAVLQHVKSDQGRSLQYLGKARVSVNIYVNVICQWYAYASWCCATTCQKWTRSFSEVFWENTCFCQYSCQRYTSVICIRILMLCVLQQVKSEQGRPCSVLGKHVPRSILMSVSFSNI